VSLLPIVTRFNQPEAVGLPTRQVHEQGDVNCCVSCALGAALEAVDPSAPPLAPLYHFFFAGGPQAIESGLTISQAQGALLRKGMCALTFHRFAISRSSVVLEPNNDAIRDGLGRRPIDPASLGAHSSQRWWPRVCAGRRELHPPRWQRPADARNGGDVPVSRRLKSDSLCAI
jgi:hypothetical protein